MLAKLNPLTYGVDSIRQLFLAQDAATMMLYESVDSGLGITVAGHKMGILEDVLVMVVLGCFLLSAAVWSFNRQE